MPDICYSLVKSFLAKSMSAAKALAEGALNRKEESTSPKVSLFRFVDGKKTCVHFEDAHFYLRGSVEYTNPQLTAEEVQGIIGIRLLQTCANYCLETGMHEPTNDDYSALFEELQKPPQGYVVPFMLNTDDVEADRYSINPLRQSIIDSGQSAFPAANIKTDQLKVDRAFVEKYEGTLITKDEAELITEELQRTDNYMDFVDAVKFRQLEELSKVFGMNLSLYALRMPLSPLQTEKKGDILHYIISQAHQSYQSIEQAYNCMGRSMTKRTTLLTVPHSAKGYGSKRAAHGKLHFDGSILENVTVKYKTTELYPNGIDPKDIAQSKCEDEISVLGEKLADYSYVETPSSPQFFLYALASPEDAAVWHGVGKFAAPQLLQTYITAHKACNSGALIPGLAEKFGLRCKIPLQFNLVPDGMWRNPARQNIDASIGTINVNDLVGMGMWLEHLSEFK
jgi:hypothetical protein